ncbi:PaaI family thioesterase [Erythrobacteraceae bacterium CFH 75059]|uniref:PaaI family thioesterase n=1 Tax=Qipengyuania thermophila TaxID=2509361 RepID=UPI0010202D74|nr:PaaI family thioesterase [Qipengyuania thermophila]TCD05317.1 PaaI family thioesterase [Erythrobacteraceae bacterium CFH 75059]
MRSLAVFFDHQPDPDHPGWHTWDLKDETRFNGAVMGKLLVRREGDHCRLRMFPERRHTNLQNMVHGAVTLGLIDIALFAALRTLSDNDPGRAVTLELSSQFIGAGKPDEPLDAVTELLRETRQFVFLRGQVVQRDHLVASFSGMIRKAQPS